MGSLFSTGKKKEARGYLEKKKTISECVCVNSSVPFSLDDSVSVVPILRMFCHIQPNGKWKIHIVNLNMSVI